MVHSFLLLTTSSTKAAHTKRAAFLRRSIIMNDNHFLASEYPPSGPEHATFHVIPAPLEASVSYGSGTRLGPAALLAASQQLEAQENSMTPCAAGVHTTAAVDCSDSVKGALARIEARVTAALAVGAVPVTLGGEHTVTLGALRALCGTRNGEQGPLGVIQFDAHADLRSSYEGNMYSHASVMYRAVTDLPVRLAQFAVRDICSEEVEVRRARNVWHHDAEELTNCAASGQGLPDPLLPPDFPRDIYISFDVDGLDASLMPATGTPSPGGLFWHDTRRLLTQLVQGRRVLGLDVVELAPIKGLHHADFTAAKLTHLLMGLAHQANSVCGGRA